MEFSETFFGLSPNLLCVVDPSGRVVRANPAWETVLGHPAETFGLEFLDLAHPDDREPIADMTAALAASDKAYGFVGRFRHADGSWRSLSWTAGQAGGLIYASATDVTEELHLRRERDRSQEMYAALFADIRQGVVIQSRDGSIRQATPRHRRSSASASTRCRAAALLTRGGARSTRTCRTFPGISIRPW